MNIDFHHTVTYVTARLAGFGHSDAETISCSAQYVDDATNDGTIYFNNNAMYKRISSAHKMLDYRNWEKLANHRVWLPFHFLPGNGGKPAGKNPEGTFIQKVVCKPNSHVAKEMIRACIREQNTPYSLHRLGITMHVYADTWAHQGFAGVNHKINEVHKLDDHDEPAPGFFGRIKEYFKDKFDEQAGEFVGDALPLGHGAALAYPDEPFLKWSYKNGQGVKINRDNTRAFTEAANNMCKAMQQYLAGDPDHKAAGLPPADRKTIREMLKGFTDREGERRHKRWLQAIEDGRFSFPPERLDYRPKGEGSWKHDALGTLKSRDKKNEIFNYDPSFLKSDWKMFHDAAQIHRFSVIHNILPEFGICAA